MNYKKLAGSLIAAATLLVSCSKKTTTGVEDVQYTGAKMVNFSNYQGYQQVNIPLGNNWISFDYNVKLSNTTGMAGNPIVVNLIKDDNPINEYNTVNGTDLIPVPPSAYRFDTTTVTIRPGARIARVHFEINPSRLNLANAYAFGISIASVNGDGAVVSNNEIENSLVVEFGALNAYDGYYTLRARTVHPTNSTLAGAVGPYSDVPLITYSADAVIWGETHPWANGSGSATPAGYEPIMTINATTNAVTVTDANGLGFQNIPGANNRYDPATKTIYAAWRYSGAGGFREFYDTLVYDRPR